MKDKVMHLYHHHCHCLCDPLLLYEALFDCKTSCSDTSVHMFLLFLSAGSNLDLHITLHIVFCSPCLMTFIYFVYGFLVWFKANGRE